MLSTYTIALCGNPNSCAIFVGGNKFRSLIDSGAECSLISSKAYNRIKNKPILKPIYANLQSVSGSMLNVKGKIELSFRIGGLIKKHDFFVVDNISRTVILGRDFLTNHGVRLYFDLGVLRIDDVYIPLEQDSHIASVVRLEKETLLKPNTAYVIRGQVRSVNGISINKTYKMTPSSYNYIWSEPYLQVFDSVIHLSAARRFPVMLINHSQKTIKLRKGCPLGLLSEVKTHEICSIKNSNNNSQTKRSNYTLKEIQEELSAPEEHRDKVLNLVQENIDIFAKTDADLGTTNTIKLSIPTGDHPPIKLRPYRIPLNDRPTVAKAIDDMESAGIIRRSHSPWSAPILLIPKRDGTKRFCLDFRRLNKIIKPTSYPLPLIEDMLAVLGQSKYFTSLDLRSAYWQMEIEEEDKPKTAFATFKGLFEFNKSPFGLSNCPGTYQSLIDNVLADCQSFAGGFLDDILIFSKDLESHYKHIQIVFDRLREHGLKLKMPKCQFLSKETNYLGFLINEQGIRPLPEKVEAIKAIPTPKCVRDVRALLGAAGFYRRFIADFSKISIPLISLTQKRAKFIWTKECEDACKQLKEALGGIPSLAYPDTSKPYFLYCDSSDKAIGSCLTQKVNKGELSDENGERPIHFLSHKLSKSQQKWPIVVKECFAIYYSLQKLNHYLHNAEFTIYTDQKSLKYLLDSPMQNRQVKNWSLMISAYNCEIKHLPGRQNIIADFLSRIKTVDNHQSSIEDYQEISDNTFRVDNIKREINVIDTTSLNVKHIADKQYDPQQNQREMPSETTELNMIQEQDKDPQIVDLKTRIQQSKLTKPEQYKFIVMHDLVYYVSHMEEDPILRLYIPPHLREQITKQYHDQLGHFGVQRLFATIKEKYYWPKMFHTLNDYVSKCITCKTRSLKALKTPMQETGIPNFPMSHLSIDFQGPFVQTRSHNRYILCFMDQYSGWLECFPTHDKSTDTVINLLLEEIISRYGCPLRIITDNGKEFTSDRFQSLLQELHIDHVRTSNYAPWSNGNNERSHKTINDILAKQIQNDSESWDVHLNQTLAAIRATVSSTTKHSPYYLMFNRDILLPIDKLCGLRNKYYGDDYSKIALQKQHEAFVNVRRRIKLAKRKRIQRHNDSIKPEEFKINDAVYYRNNAKSNKLDLNWKSHYRILQQLTPVTFLIKNQLDNSTIKAHARHLRQANLDDWPVPNNNIAKMRRAKYVIPPENDSSSDSDTQTHDHNDNHAQLRLVKQRLDSDEEEIIPLSELQIALRQQKQKDQEHNSISSSNSSINYVNSESNSEMDYDDNSNSPTDYENEQGYLSSSSTIFYDVNECSNQNSTTTTEETKIINPSDAITQTVPTQLNESNTNDNSKEKLRELFLCISNML